MMRAELEAGSMIGWGALAVDGIGLLSFLYLVDLDVHPDARRRGVAGRLVSSARVHAREVGLASIEVSWLSADPRASAFWRSQGFTPYLARGRGGA